MFQTELRKMTDRSEDDINGIFNIGDYVVNIKNLTIYKEDRSMLEQERNLLLEQLKAWKSEQENSLEAMRAQDVNSLVNARLETVRASIEEEVSMEHEAMIARAEIRLEVLNEKIAEVEAIEVEMPTNEENSTVDNVEEVTAETVEVEMPVEEFQHEMPADERPMI